MPLFLEKIEEKDREFAQKIKSLLEFVNRDDTLPAKTRILISLAIDAVQGKEEGVISIAARAREMGVSDDEISRSSLTFGPPFGNTVRANHSAYHYWHCLAWNSLNKSDYKHRDRSMRCMGDRGWHNICLQEPA